MRSITAGLRSRFFIGYGMSQQTLKLKHNITQWDILKLNYWGITKAGNTSMKLALLRASGIGVSSDDDSNAKIHSVNYITYITPETANLNGYRNFTVVRNPYDRFVSMYKDSQKRPNILGTKGIKTINELLNKIENTKDKNRNVHLRSQSYFIVDDIEYFDLDDIHRIGQELNLDIPHTNSIEQDVILTEAQKERVYNIYKEDFERFQYRK